MVYHICSRYVSYVEERGETAAGKDRIIIIEPGTKSKVQSSQVKSSVECSCEFQVARNQSNGMNLFAIYSYGSDDTY